MATKKKATTDIDDFQPLTAEETQKIINDTEADTRKAINEVINFMDDCEKGDIKI